jgi:hypothetical protein
VTPFLTRCLVAATSVCALVACEVGSNTGKPVAGDAAADATKIDPDPDPDPDAGAPEPDAATPPSDTGAPTDAPPAEAEAGGSACDYPVQCPQTRGVGEVSGDTAGDGGGNAVHATGQGSEWLSVRVTEDDSNPIGRALSLTASLTTAPGTDYDIYLYVNDGSAKAECTNVAGHASVAGTTQIVTTSWGEGTVSNGKIDSATVTVRLQHVSGPCDASGAWTLDLTGNTQ